MNHNINSDTDLLNKNNIVTGKKIKNVKPYDNYICIDNKRS